MKALLAIAVLLAACATTPTVRLDDAWPAQVPNYLKTTDAWTRDAQLHGDYQEVVDLRGLFKSPDWRAAHAERVADQRALRGDARDQLIAQAKADMAGPYEVALFLTTWDRRENDLDRGKKSVWRIVLVDDQGKEIEPIEIVRDRRPLYTLHAEFPSMNDFATAYVARFPRSAALLGANVRSLTLRMSGERGAVDLVWAAP